MRCHAVFHQHVAFILWICALVFECQYFLFSRSTFLKMSCTVTGYASIKHIPVWRYTGYRDEPFPPFPGHSPNVLGQIYDISQIK